MPCHVSQAAVVVVLVLVAGLCNAAGAKQLLLSEDGVNFVPRNSSSTAAVVKVGHQ